MKWLWPQLWRGEIKAVLLGLAILGVVIFASVTLPKSGRHSNWGFGPAWDCHDPGEGDPICFKKPFDAHGSSPK
jgi:hypothetical protein